MVDRQNPEGVFAFFVNHLEGKPSHQSFPKRIFDDSVLPGIFTNPGNAFIEGPHELRAKAGIATFVILLGIVSVTHGAG